MKSLNNAVSNSCSFGTFKFTLDKSSRKFQCPRCGKRRFVRYLDTTTGEYLDDQYGRCDREATCAYWLKPDAPASERQPVSPAPPTRKVFIPTSVYKASRRGYDQNSFVGYLLTLFDVAAVTDLIKNYAIGTSKYFPGACVFWFLDQFGNVVAGQIKPFDQFGHTVKDEEGEALTTWVHSVLRAETWAKEYNKQEKKITCLYGEHLLKSNPGKPIALVESPKTAIIATPYFPKFLWMATGSLSYLTPDRAKVLKGRRVILFPDLNAYDKWEEKGSQLGFATSDVLERNATDEDRKKGLDLADFLVKVRLQDFLKIKEDSAPASEITKQEFDFAGTPIDPVLGYPVTWIAQSNITLQRSMERHPHLRTLVERFDLQVTEARNI